MEPLIVKHWGEPTMLWGCLVADGTGNIASIDENKFDSVSQDTKVEKKLAFQQDIDPKTELRIKWEIRIHHELLQEMQAEALGIEFAFPWLKHHWNSVRRC